MPFAPWYIPDLSGGFLIALISVIHVFVSQFAVGGGFFLVIVERKALQENSAELLNWVYAHAKFFLLLTMVFGGLTGVGIWLIIALVSPAGTALLVNTFVFGWATEWAFFLGEIVALLLYVASFPRLIAGTMPAQSHLTLGWFYAIFAFLSLFVINGIITFMATPGEWLSTKNFWDGFFNPTFWPSLVFRTAVSLMLAGLFGLITAMFIQKTSVRHLAVQTCAKWICLPIMVLLASTYWYYYALPPELHQAIGRGTADIRPFIRFFVDTIPLLLLVGIILFVKLPKKALPAFTIIALLLGFVVNGAFEWVRETARRPWLVYDYMYSNGVTKEEAAAINKFGNLAASPWTQLTVAHALAQEQNQQLEIVHPSGEKSDTPHLKESDGVFVLSTAPKVQEDQSRGNICLVMPQVTQLSAPVMQIYGRAIFMEQCSTCHGQNAPMLNIVPRVADRRAEGIVAQLMDQEQISPYMPPFFGTRDDALALARWLVLVSNEPALSTSGSAQSHQPLAVVNMAEGQSQEAKQ